MKNKEKKIWIAGPGLGGMRLMTRQVSAVLKMARLFIGSSEVLETVRRYASENGARCVSAVRTAQVRRAVVEAEEERIVVLTAEDPATSASARDITRSLADLSPVILPGIPVVSYAASRFGITCPDAVYADLNCSRPGIAALCRQHEYVLIRTGVHTQEMFEQLMEAGLRDVQMMVLDRPAGEKRESTERPAWGNGSCRTDGRHPLSLYPRGYKRDLRQNPYGQRRIRNSCEQQAGASEGNPFGSPGPSVAHGTRHGICVRGRNRGNGDRSGGTGRSRHGLCV